LVLDQVNLYLPQSGGIFLNSSGYSLIFGDQQLTLAATLGSYAEPLIVSCVCYASTA
jgi:hypothetical protein